MTDDGLAVIVSALDPGDAAALSGLAKACFLEAYAGSVAIGVLQAYADARFRPGRLRRALSAPQGLTLAASIDAKAIGYAQLVAGRTPPGVPPGAVQLKRFYLRRACWGGGAATELMAACLGAAADRGWPGMWLGCWRENHRAQAFYRKWGFQKIGQTTFKLGHLRQIDDILARPVGPAGRRKHP